MPSATEGNRTTIVSRRCTCGRSFLTEPHSLKRLCCACAVGVNAADLLRMWDKWRFVRSAPNLCGQCGGIGHQARTCPTLTLETRLAYKVRRCKHSGCSRTFWGPPEVRYCAPCRATDGGMLADPQPGRVRVTSHDGAAAILTAMHIVASRECGHGECW